MTGSSRLVMNYKIHTYGSDILRKKSDRVKKVTEEIRKLARDMLTTMYASNGVGLAAEQIGRSECICVIDVSPPPGEDGLPGTKVPMPLVLVNPEITRAEGESVEKEGCLSFPDIFVPVARPAEITVRYMDLDNRTCEVEADGLLARAIQHEMDHLNGVLLYDHMSAVQKIALAGKLRRLKKSNEK